MKKTIVFLLLTACLGSCTKENSNYGSKLEGSWEMTSYVAFLPVLPALNANDVIWNFNFNSNKLTVTNNVSANYPYLLASGIYDIAIASSTVTIDSVIYTYRFEGEVLIIENHPEVDGPSMRFKRR